MRTYSEMIQLGTYEDRFRYLRLNGVVSGETFGFDRYLNQRFYRSPEWKRVRDYVMVRDGGCDLGLRDYPIHGQVIIHHMNPMSIEDLEQHPEYLLDPEYLVCVSLDTHNAIHYGVGDEFVKSKNYQDRVPGDTKLW